MQPPAASQPTEQISDEPVGSEPVGGEPVGGGQDTDRGTEARHRRTRWLDFLPGLVAVAVVVTALLATQTPVGAIVRYAVYLVYAVLVPGTLVHRALRGRHAMLVADLGLGAATGLLLELVAWALFVIAGIGPLLWLWPLAVIVPFAALPTLRRHWRPGGHTERSPVTSWLLTGALSLYTATLAVTSMRDQNLPPRANAYYIDVYWHLANAAELSRHLPPEVPSVAGRTLRYHWFSSAHVAASHLITGLDLPLVMLRFSTLPVVAIVLGLLLAVARKAAGRAWPGGVAALIVVAPAQLIPWAWYRPITSAAIIEGSPSQLFCLVSLLLGAHVLIDLVRGQRLGAGGWAVLALAVAAAPGSKPAVLPVLMGGVALVIGVNLLRRQPVRPLLVAIAMMIVSIVVFSPLVAQSTAGSGIKVFGVLAWLRVWTDYTHAWELPGTGRHLMPGMGQSVGNFLYGFLLIGTILLQFVFILAALPLFRRRASVDRAALFLLGGVLAGIAGMLTIDHPGLSEIYFSRACVDQHSIRRTAAVAAGAVVSAVVVVFVAHRIAGRRMPAVPDLPRAIGLPMGFMAAVLVLGVVVWLLGRRALLGTGMAFFAAAVIAATLLGGPWDSAKQVKTALTTDPAPLPVYAVSPDETLAARWVARNVPADDVVATNVHCRFKLTRTGCDSRAFWVPAFTEHRMLVESWAYTEETLAQIGKFDKGFPLFPFDDPTLLAANEAAFASPTAEGLAALCRDHEVKWLFADVLAGPVSPELNSLATVRYANEDVRVYQLPGC
jgi:hypothetical protein